MRSTTTPSRSRTSPTSSRRMARGGRRIKQIIHTSTLTEVTGLAMDTTSVQDGDRYHEGDGGDEGVRDGQRGADQVGGVCGVVPDDSTCVSTAVRPASRPPAQWKLVKKRGIVPDGLVQARLDNFVRAFPNLTKNVSTNYDKGNFSSNGGPGLSATVNRKRKSDWIEDPQSLSNISRRS